MKIGPDYKIEGDRLCLTLYHRRIPKKGKFKGQVVWDIEGYFNSGRYDHVLERLIDLEVSCLEDLEKVVKCCDYLKSWMRDAIKNCHESS